MLDGLEFFCYTIIKLRKRETTMKFYNKCECCGKEFEVFPIEFDCLEYLNYFTVCSEECNEEMEHKQWN